MLYQVAVSIMLLLLVLNILLNLRSLRTARSGAALPDPAPLISVLIPARDEEANIGACIDSLRRQGDFRRQTARSLEARAPSQLAPSASRARRAGALFASA